MAKKRTLTQVKLDRIAAKVAAYRQAITDIREMVAYKNQLEADIKKAMGDREEALVAGVPVFVYRDKDAYRWAEIAEDHGHLTQGYMVPREGFELDRARFAADHPEIMRQYQTREFRLVSSTKAS